MVYSLGFRCLRLLGFVDVAVPETPGAHLLKLCGCRCESCRYSIGLRVLDLGFRVKDCEHAFIRDASVLSRCWLGLNALGRPGLLL